MPIPLHRLTDLELTALMLHHQRPHVRPAMKAAYTRAMHKVSEIADRELRTRRRKGIYEAGQKEGRRVRTGPNDRVRVDYRGKGLGSAEQMIYYRGVKSVCPQFQNPFDMKVVNY